MKAILATLVVSAAALRPAANAEPAPADGFRAGAYAMDVTPTGFPVIVNGGFLSKTAASVHDPLHVRWLVLESGGKRLALGVLDTCLIPTDFADAVRARCAERTGIPADHIMISATHTHSTPSLMQALGTPPDPNYPDFALPRIVDGLQAAVDRLAPARAGWTSTRAPDHTHTRVWIRRPDKMLTDPFGGVTVRAHMHPGHESPDIVGPSGPSDPEIAVLAVQSTAGRPVAVLANFAMHYYGAPPVSSDYFGLFARHLAARLGATNGAPEFVGILSQGFSGDQHWMDYGKPARKIGADAYAAEVAGIVADACRTLDYHDRIPLSARTVTRRIATRQPDAARAAWARTLANAMGDRLPKDRSEVYAREQLWLLENPYRDARLQALRVGGLGIAAAPCEVFAISSLKIKGQSPFDLTMNVSLANGAEGYIPPPELHPLGGYNTWPCRTAGLEEAAEPMIVEALTGLLEDVAGRARRPAVVTHGAAALAILSARPLAYWRMEDWGGEIAADATGNHHGTYDPGTARALDGPDSPAFFGPGAINRAVHFAGGGLRANLPALGENFSVSLRLWNGLAADARPVTGDIWTRGGERLFITGTDSPTPGRLAFASGDAPPLTGRTAVPLRTWIGVTLVREGTAVRIHLNGDPEPDLAGDAAPVSDAGIRLAGGATGLEGRLDEVAVFARALAPGELRAMDHRVTSAPAVARVETARDPIGRKTLD